jgi:hypothetical protein
MTRLLFLVAVLLLTASPCAAQKLLRDYDFPETLNDAAGQGPDLQSFSGMLGFKSYSFGPGAGLRLGKAGVTDHYTVEVVFRFDDTASWQKIVDFKNRARDTGLYVYNGRLQFYNLGIGGEFTAGKDHTVRLERDGPTKRVRGYLDGERVFEFTDSAEDAVFQDQAALFFVDDDATRRSEESGGRVQRIRLWDAPGGRYPGPPRP